jgi:hypothetical protein
MFEKYEVWQFSSPSAPDLLAQSMRFWQSVGYAIVPTSPQSFQGRSVQPRLGFHRVVDIGVFPVGAGGTIQTRFRAAVTDEGLGAGAVVGALLLPAAVIGGAVSWHEYEDDWRNARANFWAFLLSQARAQPTMPARPPVPSSAPPPPPTSPSGTPPPPGG